MDTLIKADQTLVLCSIITVIAAVSIRLEQKYKWATKLSSSIIALTIGLILSNLKIIPTDAPAYDVVWSYVIPLSIPMLLFNADMKRIWRDSGRLLGIFCIGSVGTFLGALIGYFLLNKFVPGLHYVATIMTGSYIGGGVNFVALSDAFDVPGHLAASASVADNLMMAVYFFVLLSIPNIAFFRKHFSHPLITEQEKSKVVVTASSTEIEEEFNLTGKSEITVKDVAYVFACAFAIVAASTGISNFFARVIPTSNPVLAILNSVLGNMYFVLTTLTAFLATYKSDFFSSIKGAQEIGMFFMIIFMVVIAIPASISEILKNAPLLFVFCGIMVVVNMAVSFIGAKIFKFSIEETIIASNANIGGPATAAGMAGAKGWSSLMAPSILVGVFGYIIGNYLGILVYNILS